MRGASPARNAFFSGVAAAATAVDEASAAPAALVDATPALGDATPALLPPQPASPVLTTVTVPSQSAEITTRRFAFGESSAADTFGVPGEYSMDKHKMYEDIWSR